MERSRRARFVWRRVTRICVELPRIALDDLSAQLPGDHHRHARFRAIRTLPAGLVLPVAVPAEVPAARALLDREVAERIDETLAVHQMMPPSTSALATVFVPQTSHQPSR